MGSTIAKHTESSHLPGNDTPIRTSLRQAEALRKNQRAQREQEARDVLEGFRIREALRLQIDSSIFGNAATVNIARLAHETANRPKRDAFNAFEQAQLPAKRTRIQDDSVSLCEQSMAKPPSAVPITALPEPEHVAEAEAVVPVVDAAEAVVVSVVEAPEAVLVVVDVTEAELNLAELAAAEAIAYVFKVRRDIFLQEREARNSQLALNHRQLALNHEGRMRAECERVERGVAVAPVEYILGDLPRGACSYDNIRYYRVLLGECNVTFSIIDGAQNTREQWEFCYRKTAPFWRFWNPLKGSEMPQIDPDFQDDVFILPHFREEIATYLESQSMIHTAITSTFFLGPNAHPPYKLDASFEVTLKFLARMKKFNRLEFATISCAL